MKLKTLIVACTGVASVLLSQSVLAKTEVNFWYAGGSKPQKIFEKMIKDFNQSQSEYHINGALQGSYTETFQKLQAGMASKTAPEFALLTASQADSMANRHLLRDLRSYIKPDFHFDDFVAAFRQQVTRADGSVIALPAYGTTQILYYNKKVLKDNGFSAKDLSTWQGLAKVAAAVTKKDGDRTTFYGWEPMWGYENLLSAVYSNGGKVISDDGKKILIDSPKWIEVWDGFRKWIHDDQIMRIHYGGQGWEYWYKTIDDVMKGRALGYTGSSGDQADLDFTKLAATIQPGWGSHQPSPMAGAQVFVMPKGTSDKAALGAFAFMKYYTNAENTASWSMQTGYIPVRMSVKQVKAYDDYVKANPQALVPLTQANLTKNLYFVDPTNGKIKDALKVAADQVEIQNVPAAKALKMAARKAQRALDRANHK